MAIGPQKRPHAGKPRKRVHRARPKSGWKRRSIGWLAANRRTAPDAAFSFPAKQCAAVVCSGNPSRLARPRDETGLPVVGSAGDDALDHQAELARRTNTPVSMQLEVGQKTHTTMIYYTIYLSSILRKHFVAKILP